MEDIVAKVLEEMAKRNVYEFKKILVDSKFKIDLLNELGEQGWQYCYNSKDVNSNEEPFVVLQRLKEILTMARKRKEDEERDEENLVEKEDLPSLDDLEENVEDEEGIEEDKEMEDVVEDELIGSKKKKNEDSEFDFGEEEDEEEDEEDDEDEDEEEDEEEEFI